MFVTKIETGFHKALQFFLISCVQFRKLMLLARLQTTVLGRLMAASRSGSQVLVYRTGLCFSFCFPVRLFKPLYHRYYTHGSRKAQLLATPSAAIEAPFHVFISLLCSMEIYLCVCAADVARGSLV
jgi:hypothetical protein